MATRATPQKGALRPVAAARCAGAASRHYGARLITLRRRAEFLRLRGGTKWAGPAFLLEGKPRAAAHADVCDAAPCGACRFGFTITKKIGKAHERNRMRRRLSHALRLVALPPTLAGWDFVIIARPPARILPFDGLVRDFTTALARLSRVATGPSAAVSPRPLATKR